MKILHTSDWHLGRTLMGKKRHDEFKQMLEWFIQIVQKEHIDVFIIAGDIFDNTTPSPTVLKLYYDFLTQMATTPCQHIVIVAGNHDSPGVLTVSKELLKRLNIHVVGHISDSLEDDIFILKDRNKQAQLIVCAAPYLRERDVRLSLANESLEEKDKNLVKGVHVYYQKMAQKAQRLAEKYTVPIIATGHLFMVGGHTDEGDGVRDLYVGNEAALKSDLFSDVFNYVALGHLHSPQKVAQKEHIRYSGAPIAMGFNEKANKEVLIIQFDDVHKPHINSIKLPAFQKIISIQGNIKEIKSQIDQLKKQEESIWLEVKYTGKDLVPNLKSLIEEFSQDSLIDVLKIQNLSAPQWHLEAQQPLENLQEMSAEDVFNRLLKENEITPEQSQQLLKSYREVLFVLEHPEEEN